MASPVFVLSLSYTNDAGLVSIKIDDDVPDLDMHGEPSKTFRELASANWEPMSSTVVRYESGDSDVYIFYRESRRYSI